MRTGERARQVTLDQRAEHDDRSGDSSPCDRQPCASRYSLAQQETGEQPCEQRTETDQEKGVRHRSVGDRVDETDVVDREQDRCEDTRHTHRPHLTAPSAPLHDQEEEEQAGSGENSPQEQQRPRINVYRPDQNPFGAEDEDADDCDQQAEPGTGQAEVRGVLSRATHVDSGPGTARSSVSGRTNRAPYEKQLVAVISRALSAVSCRASTIRSF